MKCGLTTILALMMVGCASVPTSTSPVSVAFYLAESEPSAESRERTIRGSDQKIYLSGDAVLTQDHIASAKVVDSPYGPQIQVALSPDGRDRFAQLTRDNIGKHVAILVDHEVVSAPIIRDRILGGNAVIHGDFTRDEAARIADGINGR